MNKTGGKWHLWLILVAVISLPLSPLPLAAGDERTMSPPAPSGESTPDGGGLVAAAIGFYRRHVSPIDGDRCPMYPSCSQYSQDAVHKHGLTMGWIMTCDRLLRCGRDEVSVAPRIMTNNGWRCYDPVENNDFWRDR